MSAETKDLQIVEAEGMSVVEPGTLRLTDERGCVTHSGNQTAISKFGHGGPRDNSGGFRVGAGRKPDVIEYKSTGPRWFVVQSHPQAERLAAREIAERGYRAYLPMQVAERRDRVTPSMVHIVHVPLFSGYLFTEFDRDTDPWTPIRYCEGVKQIFMTPSQRPIAVPVGIVEKLIEKAPERLNLPETLMEPMEPRSVVLISAGVFEGHRAVCKSCDGRMTNLMIEVLGRAMPLLLPRSHVVAI